MLNSFKFFQTSITLLQACASTDVFCANYDNLLEISLKILTMDFDIPNFAFILVQILNLYPEKAH